MERTLWAAMKVAARLRAADRPDAELAQTFFNSVTRRVFSTVGVDAAIEYLDRCYPGAQLRQRRPADLRHATASPRWTPAWSAGSSSASPGRCRYAQLERDAALVARADRGARPAASPRARGPIELDVLRSVFYRNKGAYLVGRIRPARPITAAGASRCSTPSAGSWWTPC